MGGSDVTLRGRDRLVLGFDAGCMTCSGLAARVEEAVGDKLEVRSLYDPQVQHWRDGVFGENAPWAPTLIEVKGGRVRAWTGLRMGAHLSYALGPVATWRVMRTLGELPSSAGNPEVPAEAAAGISRRRALKGGLAGAVVGVGLLSGTDRFASRATAQTDPTVPATFPEPTGTQAEREKAKEIVRSSEPYGRLAAEQGRRLGQTKNGYGTSFDFEQAFATVVDGYAGVVVASLNPKRSVVANFLVDLSDGRVGDMQTVEITPTGQKEQARLRLQQSFQDRGGPFGRVTLKREKVALADGQEVSYSQFFDRLGEQGRAQQEDEYQPQSFCTRAVNLIGTAAGGVACSVVCVGLGLATLSIGGLACAAACAIVGLSGVANAKRCICYRQLRYCPCRYIRFPC